MYLLNVIKALLTYLVHMYILRASWKISYYMYYVFAKCYKDFTYLLSSYVLHVLRASWKIRYYMYYVFAKCCKGFIYLLSSYVYTEGLMED